MGTREHTHRARGARGASAWVAAALVALLAAFALHASPALAVPAFAAQGDSTGATFVASADAQAQITGTGSATVTTDAEGDAYLTIAISEAGMYSIGSTASTGVDNDTIGYLYDASMNQIDESDDRHADTNFTMCRNLDAGTYTLRVTGKECQQDASITVSVVKGQALNSLDCRCEYTSNNTLSNFELGTWVQGEKTEWVVAPEGSFKVVGYVDRSVFVHAQQSGAVGSLAWKAGLPGAQGRFVVMVEPAGATYVGNAYYFLDENVDNASIAELDPDVSTSVCNAISAVELGKYTTVPTNWSTRWDAITAGYYEVVGYCERSRFEALGGDDSSIAWTKGLPREVGEYVVKCTATKADENPYTGSCYVWASIDEIGHAGSGDWIVDKKATYSTAGERHLVCAYCGSPCDYEAIPPLKESLETAGSGATLADYKILSSNTVSYEKCLSTKATATVPATVKIDGATYKVVSVAAKAFAGSSQLTSATIGKNVTSIGKQAFKGCKKLTTLTVSTTKLTANSVKNCLTGSAVKTVKVPKAKKAAYAQIFTKKVCGKAVTVK